MIFVGAVGAILYLLHASRVAHPILDFSLLKIPTFRLSTIGGSLTRITQGAQPFLLSLMLQLGFGFTALQSGSITLATAVGTFSMKSLVPRILRLIGYRSGLILMGLLGSMTYAVCGFFRPDWPLPAMFAVLLLAGFFMSFQFTAYNTIVYDDVPTERMSSATSFYATFQQVTLSLGVCTAATILHTANSIRGRDEPALIDFSIAFWIVTFISFCSLFVNLRFDRKAGSELAARSI